MATFTKADDITVPQSVGPITSGSNDPLGSSKLNVFEPLQGRDLIYYNPRKIDSPVILSSFSLSMKGTMGDPDEAEFAKYNVFVNDVLIGSGETTSSFDSYVFTDVPFGKEPTLPDIVEIKVEYPEDLTGYSSGAGGWDRNLFVKSITIGSETITTEHNTQLPDVNVFYDKAQNRGGSGADSWSGKVSENGGMGWSGFMVFQIPKYYFDFIDGGPDNLPVLSTKISASYDNRIPLGTYTLNNRGTWEENNYNESTLQSYLDGGKPNKPNTRGSEIIMTPDGIVTKAHGAYSGVGETTMNKFSVDALPFVINPNNNDIIPLDRYYDKVLDKEQYELATEGKINLKFDMRRYGRVDKDGNEYSSWDSVNQGDLALNIDIFSARAPHGGYIDSFTKGSDASTPVKGSGFYLFKLNWGDGSTLEYTDKPKLLEDNVLLEHFYDKPGFYKITGICYVIWRANNKTQPPVLRTWEKFETNILLNPSRGYDYGLMDFMNFASIGGISKDSAFVKSLYNLIGIDPLTYEVRVNSDERIKAYNELDNIKILDTLGKIDNELIKPIFGTFLSPYKTPTDDEVSFTFGCMDSTAVNYDGGATYDDGSCYYTVTLNLDIHGNQLDPDIYPFYLEAEDGVVIDLGWFYRPEINGEAAWSGTWNSGQMIDIDINPYDDTTIATELEGIYGEGIYESIIFDGWYKIIDDGSEVRVSIAPDNKGRTPTALSIEVNEFLSYTEYNPDAITVFAKYRFQDFIPPNPATWVENFSNVDTVHPITLFNQIRFAWDAPTAAASDIVSFELVRSYVDNVQSVQIVESLGGVPAYDSLQTEPYLYTDYGGGDENNPQLPPWDYTYSLSVVDDAGNKSTPIELSGLIPPVNLTPEAIGPLFYVVQYEGNTMEDSYLHLRWTPVHIETSVGYEDGFGYYEIEKTNVSSGEIQTITSSFSAGFPNPDNEVSPKNEVAYIESSNNSVYPPSCYDYDIQNDTPYNYRIRGFDAAGNHSPWLMAHDPNDPPEYPDQYPFVTNFQGSLIRNLSATYVQENVSNTRPAGILLSWGGIPYWPYGTEFTITDANARGYYPNPEEIYDDWYNALDDNLQAQPFPATIIGGGPGEGGVLTQYRSLFLGFEIEKRVNGGSWFNLLPEMTVDFEDTYFPGIYDVGPYPVNTFSLTGDWGDGYGPMFMRETAILNAGIHQFPNSELPELTPTTSEENGIFNSFYDDGWPFFHPEDPTINTIESNTTYEYRIRPVYEGVYTEGTNYGEPNGTIVKDDWSDIFDDPVSVDTPEITRDIQIISPSTDTVMEIDVFDTSDGQPPQSWGPFQIKLVNIRPSLDTYMNISHNIINKLPAGGAWTKDIHYPNDYSDAYDHIVLNDVVSPLGLDFNIEVLNIWDNYTLVEEDRYVLEAHTDDVTVVNEYDVVAITPPSIEFEQTSPMDILMPPEAFEGGSFEGNVVAMDYGPAGLLYSPYIVIKRTDYPYVGVFKVDYQLSYSEDFMDFNLYGRWDEPYNADFTPDDDADGTHNGVTDIYHSSGELTFDAGEEYQRARFIIAVDDLRLQETIGIQLSNARWNNIPVEIEEPSNFVMNIIPTATSNIVYITLWDSAGDGWTGPNSTYDNARLTINGVQYTLDMDYLMGDYSDNFEDIHTVEMGPGQYDWMYERPSSGNSYSNHDNEQNSWQVALPDGTILLEGTGTNSTQTGTFWIGEVQTFNLNLQVHSSDEGDGYVTPEGSSTYTLGTEVTIEATPFQGWMFDHWSDELNNIVSENNQTTITMNDNYTLYAHFFEDSG